MHAAASSAQQAAQVTRPDLYPYGIESLPQGVPAAEILSRLSASSPQNQGIDVVPLDKPSAFVKPQSVYFYLDGNKRRWDMVSSHPSVAILLYHKTRKSFLLVRQFRPAVYASNIRAANEEAALAGKDLPPPPPLEAGFTFELCAGIVGDKPELSLVEIAHEEILEETGYNVPISKIKKVSSFLSAIGISGARQTIFAAVIDDSMLAMKEDGVGGGLAEHGEAIEVVTLPEESVESFIMDDSIGKSAGMMFALTWAKQPGNLDALLSNS